MANKIASTEGELIFAAVQPGPGQITMPTSSNTIYLTAAPTVTHKPRIAENKEKRNTLDPQPGKVCAMSIGDFKFQTHLVVSGTKGELSNIHPLLLSAYGRHTVNAGTNVTYEHYRINTEYVYLTVLVKKELETLLLADAVIHTLTLKSTACALQVVDYDGYFLTKYRAGTGHLNAAIDGTTTPVTEIVLKTKKEAETYDPGAYINIGADNNSGAGFKITAVDVDTKTVTFTPELTSQQDADAEVVGWTPVEVASGYQIDGGFGDFVLDEDSEGASPVQIVSADYTLKNNIQKIEDERGSSTGYTGRYGTATREVTFNTESYFSTDELSAEYHLKNQSQITVELNMGEEEGKKAKIEIPNLKLTDVTESGDQQKKQARQGKCYPDTGDDPSKLILL